MYWGQFGTYGSGGYIADLDNLPYKALDLLNELKSNDWLNGRTRALFIELCLMNRNNRLFTQVQIVFEFLSTGGAFTETTVISSNLYPYTDAFGYIILFLQMCFVITVFIRIVLVMVKLIKTKGSSLRTASQAFDILYTTVSVAVVVCLVMRFTTTIRVLNTLRQDMGFYTSFGWVFRWDEYYSISLGMTTFIGILNLLRQLSFNYHLFLMHKTMLAFRSEVFHCTLVLSVLIVGFASLISLIYGHTESEFRTIPTAILTLFRMTIGMIKFRNDIQVSVVGILIIFVIYALVVSIVFVNFFISSLNLKLSHIKQLIKDGLTTFDWYLSDHFWNRLVSVFSLCGVKPRNLQTEKGFKHGINLQQGETRLCQFLSKITMRFEEDTDLDQKALQLVLLHLKRRCRRRTTYNGIQYRYSVDWEKEENTLTVEFLGDTMMCDLYVDSYTITEAYRRGLVPYGNSTQPLSRVFSINHSTGRHRNKYRQNAAVTCNVMIKVPSMALSCRPTFLIIRSSNFGDWCQITADRITANEREVYLSASIQFPPQYILAVTSDVWPGIPPVIQHNTATEYVLNRPEYEIYIPGLCKKIALMFPEDSVSLDTKITILLESWEKFPILHILGNRDILGPIHFQFRMKTHHQIQTGNSPEIKLLTKEGDLEWKEGVAGERTIQTDLSIQIGCLRKGVKTSVTVCESDYIDVLQGKAGRHLEHVKGILSGIYKKTIQTQNWRKIGSNLGIPQDRLTEIELKKPRTLEEKTCIVLQDWLQTNKGRGLHEIRKSWI
ncbi:uncharacterized protein [Argopecten irradians]|uniref:uncharacterized protein n=1 Tax=Argopecten irradians TaxID=31199 RepID=UPI0037224A52